jgi:hypothetical protein
MLKTLYIISVNLTTCHAAPHGMCSAIEPWEENFCVAWPLCCGFFLQVLKTSQCRGGVVEIFNWHFKFYAWFIGGIKWWACSIRRVLASSADSLGWDVWVPLGPWSRSGPQQPPNSWLGMPQAPGWVSWPQQPPTRWSTGGRVSLWT